MAENIVKITKTFKNFGTIEVEGKGNPVVALRKNNSEFEVVIDESGMNGPRDFNVCINYDPCNEAYRNNALESAQDISCPNGTHRMSMDQYGPPGDRFPKDKAGKEKNSLKNSLTHKSGKKAKHKQNDTKDEYSQVSEMRQLQPAVVVPETKSGAVQTEQTGFSDKNLNTDQTKKGCCHIL